MERMIRNIISDNEDNFITVAESFVLVLKPDYTIKYANNALLNFFSENKNNVLGKNVFDLLPEGRKEGCRQFLTQITPQSQSAHTLQKQKVGMHLKWMYWMGNGNFDDEGTLQELYITGRDSNDAVITKKEKNKAFFMLKAFKDAIESNIICSITNAKGVILYVNSLFCDISQYSSDELVGKTHKIINSGYHPKEFYTDMWQTLLAGRMWEGEIRNRAKDGSIFWVKGVIVPILGYDNKIDGFLSMRIPITEQKMQEERQNHHIRTLEDLLFMVSHELRRPLTSLMGILNILRESMPESEEYMQLLEYMIEATDELDTYSKKMNAFLQTLKAEEFTMRNAS